MTEVAGFRVTLFFHLFFNDQKSRSSVYVNINRFGTVQSLKEHISELFNIPHDDFDLYCENNFVPPAEDIHVLKSEDTLLIVPNKSRFKRPIEIVEHEINSSDNNSQPIVSNNIKRKRFSEPEENQQIVVVSNKHKTKKKQRESTKSLLPKEQEECKNNKQDFPEAIEKENTIEKITFFEHLTHSSESSSDKAKDSMKRCSLSKCNAYNNKNTESVSTKITEESPLKETPTFVTTRKIRTSTPYVQPVGTLLKALKNESKFVQNHEGNADGEEDASVNKKRKRYRKRKRPIKEENISLAQDTPQFQSTVTNVVFKKIPDRTHITFSEEIEIIPDSSLESAAAAQDMLVETGNSTDSAIEVIDVASSTDVATQITRGATVTLASIERSPSMKTITPKAGDLIAFKMLHLTNTYTPEVSNYITAKTVYYDVSTKFISLQIIEGKDEIKLPDGKFSMDLLENLEEHGQLSEEMTINFGQLIDPRLLYP